MQASCRATTSPPPANPASGGDPRGARQQASARDHAAIGDCRSLPEGLSHVGLVTAALGLANAQRAAH